jgi:hypothetical protein
MTPKTMVRMAGLLLAGGLLLTACPSMPGGGGGEPEPTTTTTSTTSTTSTTTTTLVPPAESPKIVPNPIPVSATDTEKTITVFWNGQTPGLRGFILMCRKPHTDATFNYLNDCVNLSEVTVNPVDQPGFGSAEFTVFHNFDADEKGWTCNAPGVAPDPGIIAYETCYIRVTNNVASNNVDAQSKPFTFVLTP